TCPENHSQEDVKRIGGFHFQDGFINAYSIWDNNYRPACDDPRGMVRSHNGIWVDIYLTNTTPDLLGTSAYNAQITDGNSHPKVPFKFGGNGATQYDNFTQFTANEVLAAFGKRLPTYSEFQIFALGSKTGHAAASDPVKTKFDKDSRSMIGCEQVSGHMYQWLDGVWDRGNGSSGYNWFDANTNGKGQIFCTGDQSVGSPLAGGYWSNGSVVGSSCADFNAECWSFTDSIGSRGVCDHMNLS
ncbi:hypothetical protein I3271_05730, partial [Photobacterium leiognathi]|uniref:hypothetical protein n=1 Tax=Photobacterium leiognathi TaxID=553611 RepID=UPI001EDEC674